MNTHRQDQDVSLMHWPLYVADDRSVVLDGLHVNLTLPLVNSFLDASHLSESKEGESR